MRIPITYQTARARRAWPSSMSQRRTPRCSRPGRRWGLAWTRSARPTHLLTLAGDRMAIVPNVLTCELFAYLS